MIEQQGGSQTYGPVAAADDMLGRAPVATGIPAARARATLRPYERNVLWISRVIIVAFIILMFFPLILLLDASLSPGTNLGTFSLVPSHPTLEHYTKMFNPSQIDFLLWLRNSTIVCIGAALLTTALVISTGYAFSRFHFPGRKYGLMALLLIQMFPAQMSFVAFFLLLNDVHLLSNFLGIILVYLGGAIPFNAWLFKGYVDGLPRDLEESAYVDGATPWQAFYKIILPLTRPMMAVVFVFTLIGNYNEYILASWLLRTPGTRTMAVGMQNFINQAFEQNWTDFAAAAVLSSLPILLAFLIAQKWLVSGLAAGAVKG